ncbi:MAG: tyrosine-type recombinase/integrase [Flavobacteriaceae bacterium]|nr:tyrosine-type recombinase/integrase [Flavobacteriaceae bacterium]
MATVNFLIKTKKDPSTIYVRFRGGRKFDITTSLPFQISPKNWNPSKQLIRNTANPIEKDIINKKLLQLKVNIINEFNGLNGSFHLIDKNWLTNIVNKTVNKSITQNQITLLSFLDNYMEKVKTQPSPYTGKHLSQSRITNLQLTVNKLNTFSKERYQIDFSDITMKFYYDYIDWSERKNDAINYIGKMISNIIQFMEEAYQQKLHNNLEYKNSKFKALHEETDEIYLSIKELEKVEKVDLSEFSEEIDIARDLFLIGAYTSLRVSDFNNLSESNMIELHGKKFIKVATQKTGEPVVIPIHPVVNRILEKRNGNLPPRLLTSKINEHLTVVGKKAELDSIFTKKQTKGGKKIITNKPKYEHLKTHTARRSFCTNAFLAGIDSISIMAISGHKTEESFLKYIRVTKEQIAIRMSDHPFFKGTE